MANPQVEVQRWSAAAVNWGANSGSTGISYNLNQKLRDWITVVNANASNTNRQITMLKDEASATGTTYQGFVLKLNYNATDGFHLLHFGTNSNMSLYGAEGYLDNGTNGGYGNQDTTSGLYRVNDVQQKKMDGTLDVDLYISYDTTNDQEYFIFCLAQNSVAYRDWVGIFKTNHGHWYAAFNDGSVYKAITYNTTRNEVAKAEGATNNTEGSSTMTLNFFSDGSPGLTRWATVPPEYNSGIFFPSSSVTTLGNPHVSGYFDGGAPGDWAEMLDTTGTGTGTYVVRMGYSGPFIMLGNSFA